MLRLRYNPCEDGRFTPPPEGEHRPDRLDGPPAGVVALGGDPPGVPCGRISPVPEALLFDLGGVVIDLDFGRVFDRWAALSREDSDTLRARFRFDPAYERHERGEIDAAEYFGGLRTTLGIDLTLDEFVDGWNCVYLGPVPGVVDLLHDLSERLPLYALTNSNPSHVECWSVRYAAELSVFRSVYISSTIGVRKPESACFEMVVRDMGVAPDAVHFFDDSSENVSGARAAGMTATLVRSIDDIRAVAGAL